LGQRAPPDELHQFQQQLGEVEGLRPRQLNQANLKPVKLNLPFLILLRTLTSQEYG
jgi:hypothetical protein